MDISEQTQIYIITGVFGGIILILLAWVSVLSVILNKIQQTLQSENQRNLDNDNYTYRQPNLRTGRGLGDRGSSNYDSNVIAPRLQRYKIKIFKILTLW